MDGFAGSGVATHAGSAIHFNKFTKTRDREAVASANIGLTYEGLDSGFCLDFADISIFSDFRDDL